MNYISALSCVGKITGINQYREPSLPSVRLRHLTPTNGGGALWYCYRGKLIVRGRSFSLMGRTEIVHFCQWFWKLIIWRWTCPQAFAIISSEKTKGTGLTWDSCGGRLPAIVPNCADTDVGFLWKAIAQNSECVRGLLISWGRHRGLWAEGLWCRATMDMTFREKQLHL